MCDREGKYIDDQTMYNTFDGYAIVTINNALMDVCSEAR